MTSPLQVYKEFLGQVKALTVHHLLDQFVRSKGTGKVIPGTVIIIIIIIIIIMIIIMIIIITTTSCIILCCRLNFISGQNDLT